MPDDNYTVAPVRWCEAHHAPLNLFDDTCWQGWAESPCDIVLLFKIDNDKEQK